MERARWKLTVVVSRGSGMPGDQGAGADTYISEMPIYFAIALLS
jgi:hypothetical protein